MLFRSRSAYAPAPGEDRDSLAGHLEARLGEEAIEGMRAFREKRKPAWGA